MQITTFENNYLSYNWHLVSKNVLHITFERFASHMHLYVVVETSQPL